MLKFVKTLALFGYFTVTIFTAALINLPALFHTLNSRSACRIMYLLKLYHFCYSSFLKICKAVANRPLKQLVIANHNGFSVCICGATRSSRKNLYKFIARAGFTPTLLCFLLAPGSLRSRRVLPLRFLYLCLNLAHFRRQISLARTKFLL